MADQNSPEAEETRRFTIELPLSIYRKLDPHLSWGMKKLLFAKLSSMAAEVIDKHGEAGLNLILADVFELRINRDKIK